MAQGLHRKEGPVEGREESHRVETGRSPGMKIVINDPKLTRPLAMVL
jgi:hypothetical protein